MSKKEVREMLTRIQKKFSEDSYCYVEFTCGENNREKLFLHTDTIVARSVARRYVRTNASLAVEIDLINETIDIQFSSHEISFNRYSYIKKELLKKGFDVDEGACIKLNYQDANDMEEAIIDNIKTLVSNYLMAFDEKEMKKRNKEFLAARSYLISTRQGEVDHMIINQLVEGVLLPDVKNRLLGIKKDLLHNRLKIAEMDWHKEYYSRISSLDNIEGEKENERMNRIMFDFYRLGDHTILKYGYAGKSKGISLGLILYCRYYSKCGFNVLNYKEHCEKYDRFEKDVLGAVEKKLFDKIVSYEKFEKALDNIIEIKLQKMKQVFIK